MTSLNSLAREKIREKRKQIKWFDNHIPSVVKGGFSGIGLILLAVLTLLIGYALFKIGVLIIGYH
jgi:hypothetical protein